MKEMICQICPNKCHLSVTVQGDTLSVTGNQCPRGVKFATDDWNGSRRVVTGFIQSNIPGHPTIEVHTTGQVPAELIFKLVRYMKKLSIEAPVQNGDIIEKNVCGFGVDLVVDDPKLQTATV